jgi:hypothetical protein
MSCINDIFTIEKAMYLAERGSIYWIPTKFLTKEVFQAYLRRKPDMIRYVPKEHITPELYLFCVKSMGCLILDVPEKLITEELCHTAVRSEDQEYNSYSVCTCGTLQFVPKEFITKELCTAAVECCGYNIQFVPKEYITQELCLLAVSDSSRGGLQFIQEKYLTDDICMKAVTSTRHFNDMKYIPKRFLTKKLCVAAVLKHGGAIRYVPKEYINYDLCVAAVSKNGDALEYIPLEYVTKELCDIAVYRCGNAIGFVPDEFITEDLCTRAVINGCYHMQYIHSEEMYIEYLKRRPSLYGDIMPQYNTYNVYYTAILYAGLELKSVPTQFITKELCRIAIDEYVHNIKYVPENIIDNEMCEYIANKHKILSDIPIKYRTKKICLICIEKYYDCFEDVPEELRTNEDFILSALKINHDVIKYIPFTLWTGSVREYILGLSGMRKWIQDNLPQVYYQWKHEKTTRDVWYFCNNLGHILRTLCFDTSLCFGDITIK